MCESKSDMRCVAAIMIDLKERGKVSGLNLARIPEQELPVIRMVFHCRRVTGHPMD